MRRIGGLRDALPWGALSSTAPHGARRIFGLSPGLHEPEVRRAAVWMLTPVTLVVIPGYVGFSSLFAPQSPFVYGVLGAGWLVTLLGLLALRRGRQGTAASLLVVVLWSVVAGLVLHNGASSPHVGAFSPAIVFAALSLNTYVALLLSALSVLVVVLARWLELGGFLGHVPEAAPDIVAPIAQILATGAFTTGLIEAFASALGKLRRREQELEHSEQRYAGLFEHSPDGIVLVAEDGSIAAMNEAALKLFSDTKASYAGVPFADLPFVEQSRAVARELASGAGTSGEVIVQREHGPCVLAVNATKLGDERSRQGVQLTLRDVTAAKRAEEAERMLAERLRRSERMEAFGQLAGGVAHDFNNILTSILGQLDLMRMSLSAQPAAPALLARLDELERAAERAASITTRLLTFSSKGALDPGTSDVSSTLERSEPFLRSLIRENVGLELELRPVGVAPLAASALEQIVMNLVLNACDAMPRGGTVRIRTRRRTMTAAAAEPERVPGSYACLEVSDDGAGISEADLPRIYEPFFTTKPRGQGTGLGLSTVHGLVHRAGGYLDVRSRVGEGTCFEVLLPEVEAPPREEHRASVAGARTSTKTGLILVCEDDASIRDIVREVLTARGFEVQATGSPREALALAVALRERLALLISDVIMPELSGPELVSALRERVGEVPVLYISGYTAGLLEGLGLREEDPRLLHKPFSATVLLERVAALVGA